MPREPIDRLRRLKEHLSKGVIQSVLDAQKRVKALEKQGSGEPVRVRKT